MIKQSSPLKILLSEGARPSFLLFGFLYYGLGVSISSYLEISVNWSTAILGLGYLWMLQLASYMLSFYFDRRAYVVGDQQAEEERANGDEEVITRNMVLAAIQAGLSSLAVAAAFTAFILWQVRVDLRLAVFLFLAFLLGLAFAVPPIQADKTGYGEFLQAVWIGAIFPAIGFLLQYGDLHRMLAMLAFPLSALLLAVTIALSLPHYARDINQGRVTMVIRMGWRLGMRLHNILILAAYLSLVSLSLFGLPWKILWPGLLPLPFGLVQVWTIERIAAGRKPPWNLLRFTSLVTVCFTVYLLIFSLWMD